MIELEQAQPFSQPSSSNPAEKHSFLPTASVSTLM
jgi:hypothetical protein